MGGHEEPGLGLGPIATHVAWLCAWRPVIPGSMSMVGLSVSTCSPAISLYQSRHTCPPSLILSTSLGMGGRGRNGGRKGGKEDNILIFRYDIHIHCKATGELQLYTYKATCIYTNLPFHTQVSVEDSVYCECNTYHTSGTLVMIQSFLMLINTKDLGRGGGATNA